MTTHQPVYPTAPPWATPDAARPGTPAEALANGPSYPQIGGLLVPYPEEMRHAARAQAPALWPVAVLTFLLGVFGAISAARRAKRARRSGNNPAPYWITYAVTMLAGGFVWFVVTLTVVQPLVTSFLESRALSSVEDHILHDGQLAKANLTASSAACRAAGDRREDGTRDYLCRLTLADGRTGQVTITAQRDGTWQATQTR
ncbi:hypothetical protein [Actinoplanes sp. TFC3]|uniref:hypothetical protein n=1 Tax=Actinoplanes sp. TFC3 TaxID=1710355 RepID=UPI0008371AEF|nr:hypothetical protein [Actinoplanes sp. TFC3]